MSDAIDQLVQCVCDTLERHAFMFGSLVEADECDLLEPEGLCVTIGFSGDREGCVFVATSAGFASTLAENTMGIDPDDERIKAFSEDSLKEFLNILCGQLITLFYGEDVTVALAPPLLEVIDDDGWEEFSSTDGALHFQVDDFPMLLRISRSES